MRTGVGEALALRSQGLTRLRDYWALSKPKVTLLVWMTTLLGATIASLSVRTPPSGGLIFHLTIGSWFVIASANALNQTIEWRRDAKMTRTAQRPIPAGRISVEEGLWCGLLWGIVGVTGLASFVNGITAALGAVSIVLYAFCYTPLKSRTNFCTAVGAIPGAIPPLAGWAAIQNHIGLEGILLFIAQYFWQFPHFWAIAWLNQEDYARAGFKMLPTRVPDPDVTGFCMVVYSSFLAPFTLSMAPKVSHPIPYAIAASVLAFAYIWSTYRFWRSPGREAAKLVLRTSVLYLPLFFAALAVSGY